MYYALRNPRILLPNDMMTILYGDRVTFLAGNQFHGKLEFHVMES